MNRYYYILKMHKGKKFNNKKHKKRIESVLHSLGIGIFSEESKKDGCLRFLIGSEKSLDDKARLLDFIIRTTVDVDEVVLIPVMDRKPYKKPLFDRKDIVGS